ncbi:hypothetical protein MmiHf6_09550 [Methanimicrococcus hongohii]|uniref:Uncharacterized protein n=1 Tax=Methanimicrococcus hongohii TaxID=3028295 RepID=A0AA96ZTW3_9EURY|nr:hypothetical protein [Methanimicrococcus sp. Hf6]WNY23646.1 hypothetical protein MmiHf6_09550 [Methanimicrococcus sp. Hf6]
MSQKSLIAKIKDDEWFLSLIKRRLRENKEESDETERFMNEIALLSSIDFRLKYLRSMSREEMIQNILEVCKENGFIPQYDSSGSPSFYGHRVELSQDGTFTACFSDDGVVIFPSRELPLCWTKLILKKGFNNANPSDMGVSFSPDSSKVAILYVNVLHIWDVSELRVQRLENLNSENVNLENVNLPTINMVSWSADSKRISYVKQKCEQEFEICVYDIHEKRIVQSIPTSYPVSTTCLDNQGTNILLLGDSAVRIIDVVLGEEINKMNSLVSLDDAEALFKNEEFYVLANGIVLKIKDKLEMINPDGLIFPISQKIEKMYNSHMFDSIVDVSCRGLKSTDENLIMYDRSVQCNPVDYILSDTLDVKMIQRQQWPQYDSEFNEDDEAEFLEFLSNAEKKYIPYGSAKNVYLRQTKTEAMIEDSSMFKLIDFSFLHRFQPKFQKKIINKGRNVYVWDDNDISSLIGFAYCSGNERLILSEEGIEIKAIPIGNKIKSNDPFNDYYLDGENVLYCVDPFANCEKIADDSTFQHCSLNEIKWISGSTWPKIYVIGKDKSESFIQSGPMQNLFPLEDIHLSCPQNICLFSGKIYWISNEGEICVSNLDGSVIQHQKIINLSGWRSTGKTSDGRFSLVKFEMNVDQKTINVKFARLFPESGHIDVFEKANFNFRTEEAWRTDLDVKNTSIIVKEWKNIYPLTIKKEELKKGMVIKLSVDSISTNMTALECGRYIISTTEDIENPENPADWYEPRLRVMDSNKGLMIRYNLDQSGGQMYGFAGYEIDSRSKALSLDGGKFIVSEMTSSHALSDKRHGISSWDTSSGKRYPRGDIPVYGKLLEKCDEGSVLVSSASDGIVHSVSTYDKKMKKVLDEKTIFTWCQDSSDPQSEELDSDVLLEKFPCISEFAGDDCLEYIEVVKNIIPPHCSFKNGDVVILPVGVNSKSENIPSLPYIYTFDRIFDHYVGKTFDYQIPLIWMNIQSIICTYSYGRLIHPIDFNLDLVTRIEPDCKHMPCGALRHLSLCRVGDKYVVQQPVRKNLSDVPEDMRYKTRIIGDGIDFEIDDVMGWQIKGSDEEKLLSLFIDNESFSYVTVRGTEVLFVTNTGGEETIKKICNEGEYCPVALYADDAVSISFDPYRNIMFFSKEETEMIPVGNLLDNTYKYGKFNLVSKSEDGTMYFDIGYGEEIQITPDMEVQKSERKQLKELSGNLDRTTCKLDDGKVVNYNGVFVKYFNS